MKLNITQQAVNQHKDACTAVGWSINNELYSCGDDSTVLKWNMNGEPAGKACDLGEVYFTDIHWFPTKNKKSQQSATDVFVISCADGSFKLVSKTGRVEFSVDAHKGAVVCIKWNYDGTSIASGGEDGVIKIWSRSCQLRQTLASTGRCVYSIAWGPNNSEILFTSGRDLIIKPLQPSSKQMQWKAHDGPVLKVDWNPLTKLIVSGGEDGKYKVWDSYGRLMYQSSAFDYSITSVAWCPDGQFFAVGSFNMLKVCDKTGWTYAGNTTDTGSILNIAWTSDGTQLAAGGGNGAVCFGQLVERKVEWKNLVVSINETHKIRVKDVFNESPYQEELDFRDRVINMSLGFEHLVVATATQCCIFDVKNWNTPYMFDLKDTVNLIQQCQKVFLMIDNFTGIQIFNYEGRLLSNPKFAALRTEFLNPQSISLSNDTLAVIDRADPRIVRLFDVVNGKQVAEIQHHMEIMEIALDQFGNNMNRKLAFIDRNRDLYITRISRNEPYKLATMVDSVKWNDQTEMLVAIADGKLIYWLYPTTVYVDRDLLAVTKFVKDDGDYGRNSQIIDFFGTRCNIRRLDGAVLTSAVSPYPLMLYEHYEKNEWESAIRLCRFVKDHSLWACLAAMSMRSGELNTAEVSYAALDEVDKLEYVVYIKNIPTVEGRSAELALFQRRIDEAESILLQAGLIYRAIKMHIKLFNWERALELAVNYKTHVDTVIAFRQKYLQSFGHEETSQEFLRYSAVEINWDSIKAKINLEKEREKSRPGAKPYI